MLSSTNSVTDVKARLSNTYDYYGFSTELAFTTAIEVALSNVMYLYLYEAIGSSYYATISAKDKVSLTETETYLYWGEVYYACCLFIESRAANLSSASSSNTRERLKVEGYEHEIENGSSVDDNADGMLTAIREYYDMAINYMCRAGYNPHRLKIGSSPFEDIENNEVNTYIEVPG